MMLRLDWIGLNWIGLTNSLCTGCGGGGGGEDDIGDLHDAGTSNGRTNSSPCCCLALMSDISIWLLVYCDCGGLANSATRIGCCVCHLWW